MEGKKAWKEGRNEEGRNGRKVGMEVRKKGRKEGGKARNEYMKE